MKGFNLSEWAVTHRAFVVFLMLATLIGGVFSFSKLGRMEDPQFSLPIMTTVVVWPGATATEMQNQVLNKIEQEFQELDGFESVQTFSRQGYGGIKLVMKGGLGKQTLDRTWYLARKKVGDIQEQLPAGVQGPYFNDEYNDVYTALYALQAPELTQQELNDSASRLKLQLQRVPQVAKVDVLGKQQEQVEVLFSSARLAALGLSPAQIINGLAKQNQVTPSGLTDTASDRVFVRVDGTLHSAEDVAATSISAGGKLLRLSDVATVRIATEDPARFKVRYDGQPTLIVGVTMQTGSNILTFGEHLDQSIQQIQRELPVGIELHKISDQPKVVADSVWEFERAFLEALAIVLAVCLVFLGWRTGIVVATSVPLVLGIVAMVMYAMDWNLDRISLGALIIALGLLVDDAIIAVEMMVVKLEQGWTRMQAATYAYTSTAFPMLTGTLVTVAGFMPVGFAKSTSGEYAGGIFWIVGTALIASWLVAVIFIPLLGIKMLPDFKPKDGTPAGQAHDPYSGPIYQRFARLVTWAVTWRKSVILGVVALFVVAIAGMALVQQQFFPTASRPELLVEVRMREGASFEATETEVKRLEQILKKDPDVQFVTSYIGASSPRFFLSLLPELPNPSYGQLVVMTANSEAREAVLGRVLAIFDANQQFPNVRGRVLRLEFGPAVGFPVQFRVMGPELTEVRRIAAQVRDTVRQSPLVRDTQLEWNEQVRSIEVKPDQDKLRLLGLSSADVANTVQAVLSGVPATQIRRGDELVQVTVRAVEGERQQLDALAQVTLPTPSGQSVPLSQVASIVPRFEDPVLWRRDRQVVLNVRSDVMDGVQAPYATQQIWPSLQKIMDDLPAGYRIEQGGAIEESNKANKAIGAVFPVMLLTMLLFLMMQVQGFSRMFMVFLTAPLGLIGVVPALLLFQVPFGFVALLGVIALAGMIMRNSVILVVQIEQDITEGEAPWQAIINATVRRARPVILTAAAAILAMLPLSHSVFWGPMAISIMGGLVVATGLTLVFVPALYALWFRIRPDTPSRVLLTQSDQP